MPRELPGAVQAPFPRFVPPCNPTLRAQVPIGPGWLYEIKFDGYRAQIHWCEGRAIAYSRSGLDYSAQFASICEASTALPAGAAVMDGEVVVLGANGVPDFGALRSAITNDPDRLLFYAFDLLHLDGFDLRGVALELRRRALQDLLASLRRDRILMSETIDAPGLVVYRRACDLGLEGIVAKRADASYRSGPSSTWFKIKCVKSLRFPVVGFVPAGSKSIAALRLGRREGGKLVYIGKAGTGFTAQSARDVRSRLEPLVRARPALSQPIRKRNTRWVEPRIEAEIEFRGITDDGMLRHASFKGLAD